MAIRIFDTNMKKFLQKELKASQEFGNKYVKEEAERMKFLISDEIDENALNDEELEAADHVIIREERDHLLVTDDDEVLETGDVNFVVKRMEFGNSERPPSVPVQKAVRRFLRGDLEEKFH